MKHVIKIFWFKFIYKRAYALNYRTIPTFVCKISPFHSTTYKMFMCTAKINNYSEDLMFQYWRIFYFTREYSFACRNILFIFLLNIPENIFLCQRHKFTAIVIWQPNIVKYAFHNGIFITTAQKLRISLGNKAW